MNLSYTTAGGHGSPYAAAHPYVSAAVAPAPPPPAGLPPHGPSAPPTLGMMPYGVEIPNRVFVGGCPFSMTDQQLGDFFTQYGNVKDSKIIADRGTGKSKGYGFVTFSTEEEAACVHAMGSLFYNEKKLNLARAVRKCGGQFNRANQEYVNGQRAIYSHPNGWLLQQYEGQWHYDAVNPHPQPVKPCYPYYYPVPPPAAGQPPPQFFINGAGGISPVAGTTFFPTLTNDATVNQQHPKPTEPEKSSAQSEQAEVPQTDSPSAESASTPKESASDSDELSDKIKQLSLDSAYTSEADLDVSSTHSTPEEPTSNESPKSENEGTQEPLDLSKIIARKSPLVTRAARQRPPSLIPTTAPAFSSAPLVPPGGSHYFNGLTYFHPYASYSFTPQAAVQTIGPVYHGVQ